MYISGFTKMEIRSNQCIDIIQLCLSPISYLNDFMTGNERDGKCKISDGACGERCCCSWAEDYVMSTL